MYGANIDGLDHNVHYLYDFVYITTHLYYV